MRWMQSKGHQVAAMKPVSSGCKEMSAETSCILQNDDANQLAAQSSVEFPYEVINPYAFEPAIAPHIAASQVNQKIELERIVSCYQQIASRSEIVIVEGAGGWLVPINDDQFMVDIVKALKLNVILVVGIRLGCINHALLSMNQIIQSGCTLEGWVANYCAPAALQAEENIRTIEKHQAAPLLGKLAYTKQEFEVFELGSKK